MGINLLFVPTEDLVAELQKRKAIPAKCPTCNVWPTTYKCYAGRGKHWHCVGCNKWVEHCTCR